MNRKNIKNIILIVFILVLSKIIGFARDLIIAYNSGASVNTDIFYVAFGIINMCFTFISGAISVSFIPTYIELKTKKNNLAADHYTSNFINIFTSISIIVSLVGILFSPQIVSIVASGFKGDTFLQCVSVLRTLFTVLIFMVISTVISSCLQANEIFGVPQLTGIADSIGIIFASVTLYKSIGVWSLVIGVYIGGILKILIQLPLIMKKFKYKFKFDLYDKNIISIIPLFVPLSISLAIKDINIIIDRTLATNLVEGSVSILKYGENLSSAFTGFVSVVLSTILYPKISNLIANGNIYKLKKYINKIVLIFMYTILPLMLFLFINASSFINLLYSSSSIEDKFIGQLVGVFAIYSLGILPQGLSDVIARFYYSLKKTKPMLIISIISVSMNIILNIILVRKIGVFGLAISTTISFYINALLRLVHISKYIGGWFDKSIIKNIFKVLVSSVVMAASTIIIKSILVLNFKFNNLFVIIFTAITSVLIYLIFLLIILKDRKVTTILSKNS